MIKSGQRQDLSQDVVSAPLAASYVCSATATGDCITSAATLLQALRTMPNTYARWSATVEYRALRSGAP